MKQTKKLGRGLEDFSHLFLSSPDPGVHATAANNDREIPAASASSPVRAHVVCVAGERGADEKAFLTVRLAAAFSGPGKRVVVFDADFSLPRLCMLMDGAPPNSLLHLINRPAQGKTTLRERDGITLITIDADIATSAALTSAERLPLMEAIRRSLGAAGTVLVMTSGEFMNGSRIFIEAADDIVVVTPQPVAEMINAYGLIKKILQIDEHARVGIVASRSTLFNHADAVFEKMQRVVKKFLNKPLLNHGYLPDDRSISGFLKRDKPAVPATPSPETARCLEAIARSLSTGAVTPAAHPASEQKPSLAEKLFA
jgi:flagellar biosynthesis protein FlhG